MDFDYYLPGAEPFFYPGGPVGCLVTHGLASAPGEVKWLGEYLAQQGHTVYGPRLPGHGADPRDLARVHWRDWYGAVLDGYQVLRAQCEQLFLIGHSTGGTLSLLAGAHLPVTGVAALAAPVFFGGWQPVIGKWLHYVRPYLNMPADSPLSARVRAEQHRRGEPERGRIRYDRWATNGPVQLYELAKITRPQLPLLKAPLLALYSQVDRVIDPRNYEIVTQTAGSAVIEKHWLEHLDHNLMLDDGREAIFARVADFVERQVMAVRNRREM